MVTVVLLVIAMGIATDGLMQMQKRATADTGKVDMTQMSRQFVDQIVSDLHQAGYPGPRIFDGTTPPPATSIANGLMVIDPNAIEFEGDIDGSGNVSHVYLNLLWSNGTAVSAGPGACPCTLQRGTIYKPQMGIGAIPYYTEVNNVTNTNVFTFYCRDGLQYPNLADPNGPCNTIDNITDVKVTVNVQSTVAEPDGTFPTITLASSAKITNGTL